MGMLVPACSPAAPDARHEGGDRRYRAVVEAEAPEVGGEALLRARVVPAGTWHLGGEYPAVLEVAAADGVRPKRTTVPHEPGVSLGEDLLAFEVPFVAERAGEATLSGGLRFAVCRGLLCERVDHAFELRFPVRAAR